MTTGSLRAPARSRRAVATTRRSWVTDYARALLFLDATVVCSAALGAYFGRFGGRPVAVAGVPYLIVAIVVAVGWLFALRLLRSYDGKVIGHGVEEYRRVAAASLRLAGLIAIACYLADAPVARGFVGLAFPIGTLGLVAERYAARKWLHRRRRLEGGWSHRVLIVGNDEHVTETCPAGCGGRPYAGYEVVGVCLSAAPQAVEDAIARVRADTVAVTASPDLTAPTLRRLGWSLHGTGVDLVVAPALTDVAGPDFNTRPVGGLPLLHVEEPELSGPRKAAKNLTDRAVAAAMLVPLLPVMLVVAVLIRLDSRGPAFFRQRRVGMGGREFTMFKFRSMVHDAESVRARLLAHNEQDGVLFKIRRDPRITRVGRVIRKWSVDELPQLLNVIRGEMSLVGPRPPLPEEVAMYGEDVARRLLVPPGITGLWQVSGRSDLSWEDSVRLDLYYVENWSMTTDLVILWKTVGAVVRSRGSY